MTYTIAQQVEKAIQIVVNDETARVAVIGLLSEIKKAVLVAPIPEGYEESHPHYSISRNGERVIKFYAYDPEDSAQSLLNLGGLAVSHVFVTKSIPSTHWFYLMTRLRSVLPHEKEPVGLYTPNNVLRWDYY